MAPATSNEGEHQGSPPRQPRLGVLLGAGNQGMLSICDALYLLFVENMTCIIKHNPVRAYNHAWMEQLFAPLLREGYFASVLCGIEESKALLYDDRVDHVHMTGGKATHDAIVWGGSGREKNLLAKPITSELGAVTPWVIGPGEWSDPEVEHHAKYFTTVLMNNNGCNCNAPQVLLLPSDGFPADRFLATVKAIVRARPHAPPYYPGTASRHAAWLSGLEGVASTELVESNVKLPPGRCGPPLPWAFSTVPLEAVASGDSAAAAVRVEAFGPTLAIVMLPSGDDYWARAAALCNERLEGTLSCSLIEHPSCALNEADLAAWRYGLVGVNVWGGQAFGAFSGGTWGAYPGETIENVSSGVGVVRNYLFLQDVEKTVARVPFISQALASERSGARDQRSGLT